MSTTEEQIQEETRRWSRALLETNALYELAIERAKSSAKTIDNLAREIIVWKDAHTVQCDQVARLKKELEREKLNSESLKDAQTYPLIHILIDGDTLLFSPSLIAKGALGATEAFHALSSAISEVEGPHASLSVTVYFNRSELREGEGREGWDEFVKEFNMASPLFSMVDIGVGKSASDDKLCAHLYALSALSQTTKLYYGGSISRSLSSSFRQLRIDNVLSKLSLLSPSSIPPEVETMKIPLLKVDGIFTLGGSRESQAPTHTITATTTTATTTMTNPKLNPYAQPFALPMSPPPGLPPPGLNFPLPHSHSLPLPLQPPPPSPSKQHHTFSQLAQSQNQNQSSGLPTPSPKSPHAQTSLPHELSDTSKEKEASPSPPRPRFASLLDPPPGLPIPPSLLTSFSLPIPTSVTIRSPHSYALPISPTNPPPIPTPTSVEMTHTDSKDSSSTLVSTPPPSSKMMSMGELELKNGGGKEMITPPKSPVNVYGSGIGLAAEEMGVGKRLSPNKGIGQQDPMPCTFFYLSECKAGASCRYAHDYILTHGETKQLREFARQTPCPGILKGVACNMGEACIFGHECPRGSSCKLRKEGTCKFKTEGTHGSPSQDPYVPKNEWEKRSRTRQQPPNSSSSNSTKKSPTVRNTGSRSSTPAPSVAAWGNARESYVSDWSGGGTKKGGGGGGGRREMVTETWGDGTPAYTGGGEDDGIVDVWGENKHDWTC